MYGAIIGDLAGSIYEYDQLKGVKSIKTDDIIPNNAFFSDDTILTIAIIDAIKNNQDYDYYLRKYIKEYENYKPDFKPYFKTTFSPNLINWSKSNLVGLSKGNGAMMRISGIGYLFNNEEEVKENAKLATIPSHNTEEAIECATIIALVIFYLRKGLTKEEVFKKLSLNIKYKPFTKFNTTCYETLNNCLYAFYVANSYEEALKITLLMGGDTDTNCTIVGSMAESIYKIDDDLIDKANKKIPNEFIKVLSK